MKKYLLAILFALPALTVHSQALKYRYGIVRNEVHTPISGATVVSFDQAGKQLSLTVTGSDGSFRVQLRKNLSYGYVTHVGYLPYKITGFTNDTLVVNLTLQSKALAEVRITSQKPLIEQQFDRLVVNVNGDPKAGMNVTDILKKVPGVGLSGDNSITLEGKSVIIYLDGKLTRLSGRELMALLANTPTISVSQIEVMHSPPAKYDAQGDGGIINIKTIKRSKPGYDVNLSLTGGHGWKYYSNNNVYAGMNYRKGDNYLYGSYSYGFGRQSQVIETTTYLNSAGQRLMDSTRYRTPYRDQDLRLGWDHYLNKTDVFGVLITASKGHYDPFTFSNTGLYSSAAILRDSTRYSANENQRTSQGINVNLNYKTVLDSLQRRELSMDADAGTFDHKTVNQIDMALQDLQGDLLTPVQQLLQSGTTSTQIYSYKADYSQKLYSGTMEAGLKASHVRIANGFTSETGSPVRVFQDNGSNDFSYRESILAAYGSSKQIFGKLTVQGGLRAEQTFTNGRSLTADSTISRHYLNLFPNLMAGYQFKAGLLSVSYARRIGRPAYNYLNPFRIVRGAYSVYEGNPYLQPSLTDNYRMSFTYHNKLTFSAAYSKVTDVITDVQQVDEVTKITTALKANLNNNENNSFYVSYYSKLFDIFNVNYTGGLAYNCYYFNYGDLPVAVKQVTAFTYLDNQVNLPKDWWFDVYVYAQSRVTYGNQINLPLFTTQISGGKKILKGKGNVSLNVNDIFFTGIQRSQADYGNVHNEVRSRYDSRNIRVSLSYNFGNANIDIRKRTSGSADEQHRSQ